MTVDRGVNSYVKTRKSCIFLQNRLLLIYCSSVYEQFFQLHCCFYKASTASQKLLLLQQCFTCITVSMKPLLLLESFNCLIDVPNFSSLNLSANCSFSKLFSHKISDVMTSPNLCAKCAYYTIPTLVVPIVLFLLQCLCLLIYILMLCLLLC